MKSSLPLASVLLAAALASAAALLVVVGADYGAFLLAKLPAGGPSVEITDAVGVAIHRLRKQNPIPAIVLKLPRRKDQDIPVAIRTRSHREVNYLVTLRERKGGTYREIAEVSAVLARPGKYVIQLRPTVTPATLSSGPHYVLRAVLTTGAGKAKRSVKQEIPVTVHWEGSALPKSGLRPAEIAEIDGNGIPRPDVREDITPVTITPGFCVRVAYRQQVEDLSFTITFQRKTDAGSVTVAKGSGSSQGTGLHREPLRIVLREISTDTLPEGDYRLVLDANDARDPGRKIRDEVALAVSYGERTPSGRDWKNFNPFNCR